MENPAQGTRVKLSAAGRAIYQTWRGITPESRRGITNGSPTAQYAYVIWDGHAGPQTLAWTFIEPVEPVDNLDRDEAERRGDEARES